MNLPIYMDNLATTPVDPRVLEAMLPYFSDRFGNAASRNHSFGQAARQAVEESRAQIAATIHCDPAEIIFTSGATESDNLAIIGAAEASQDRGRHLITAPTEHKAVLDTCRFLAGRGWRISHLPLDSFGMVTPDALRDTLADDTVLVSIMLANNEIGVIQPVKELASIAHQHGVLFHTDAAQAIGKISVDVGDLDVDLMSFTAHKIYGPKGVGALYVRGGEHGIRIVEQMHGGGHERGMRSGTLNVPGIVGLGKACALAAKLLPEEGARLAQLRDRLRNQIVGALPRVHLNGHPAQRLPGNLYLTFDAIDGEALLAGIEDVALSAGAACTSGSVEPSYVLKALGLSNLAARSSIRFGIGRFNTEAEVDYVAHRVIETVLRLRELSPLWEDLAGS